MKRLKEIKKSFLWIIGIGFLLAFYNNCSGDSNQIKQVEGGFIVPEAVDASARAGNSSSGVGAGFTSGGTDGLASNDFGYAEDPIIRNPSSLESGGGSESGGLGADATSTTTSGSSIFYTNKENSALSRSRARSYFASRFQDLTQLNYDSTLRRYITSRTDSTVPKIVSPFDLSNFTKLRSGVSPGAGFTFLHSAGGSAALVTDPHSARRQGKVMKFSLKGPLTKKGRVQTGLSSNGSGGMKEFTHYVRVFIPSSFAKLSQNYLCHIDWLTLFELFSNKSVEYTASDWEGQFRFGIALHKDAPDKKDSTQKISGASAADYAALDECDPAKNKGPETLVSLSHKGYKPQPLYLAVEATKRPRTASGWSSVHDNQTKIPVPYDEWFTLVIYYKANTQKPNPLKDGAFKVSLIRDVNRTTPLVETIFSKTNIQTLLMAPDTNNPRIEPTIVYPHKLYTHQVFVNLMTTHAQSMDVYFDDWRFYLGNAHD